MPPIRKSIVSLIANISRLAFSAVFDTSFNWPANNISTAVASPCSTPSYEKFSYSTSNRMPVGFSCVNVPRATTDRPFLRQTTAMDGVPKSWSGSGVYRR